MSELTQWGPGFGRSGGDLFTLCCDIKKISRKFRELSFGFPVLGVYLEGTRGAGRKRPIGCVGPLRFRLSPVLKLFRV